MVLIEQFVGLDERPAHTSRHAMTVVWASIAGAKTVSFLAPRRVTVANRRVLFTRASQPRSVVPGVVAVASTPQPPSRIGVGMIKSGDSNTIFSVSHGKEGEEIWGRVECEFLGYTSCCIVAGDLDAIVIAIHVPVHLKRVSTSHHQGMCVHAIPPGNTVESRLVALSNCQAFKGDCY